MRLTIFGFSPRPEPQLIATFKTKGEALAVSKALDRDRAVDESGNQIAVFGRRGARPLTFAETQRMLRTNEGRGEAFTVTDEPATAPRDPKRASATASSSTIVDWGQGSAAIVAFSLLLAAVLMARRQARMRLLICDEKAVAKSAALRLD